MNNKNSINQQTVLEETANRMLKERLDDSLIKQTTGLSQDEIDKLRSRI